MPTVSCCLGLAPCPRPLPLPLLLSISYNTSVLCNYCSLIVRFCFAFDSAVWPALHIYIQKLTCHVHAFVWNRISNCYIIFLGVLWYRIFILILSIVLIYSSYIKVNYCCGALIYLNPLTEEFILIWLISLFPNKAIWGKPDEYISSFDVHR